MIYSMTGFGKAVVEYENKKITAILRTLNSKQADIQMRIPTAYKEKEVEMRNMLTTGLQRGKIDFSLVVEGEDADAISPVALRPDVIKEYVRQIKAASAEAGIPEPANWFEVLLRLPGSTQATALGDDISSELDGGEWEAAQSAVALCIENLNDFRAQEGVMLGNVLIEKIKNIGTLLTEVDEPEGARVAQIRARIEDGLNKLAEGFDANRLEQEMIYYIEKLDVNEEKSRLKNHLDYFADTMAAEPGQGKKLGFIAQEMGREINTLGSKSNQAEMQQIVVRMKDELEQIKEQVLNVL